jgi:DNA-binding XRE family transcriptional regulator
MMSPAEFRTLRELAGLTQSDVAAYAGVNERTARRWDRTLPAPDEVCRWLENKWRIVLETAVQLADQVGDQWAGEDEEPPVPVITRTPALPGDATVGMQAAVCRAVYLLACVDETPVRVEGGV